MNSNLTQSVKSQLGNHWDRLYGASWRQFHALIEQFWNFVHSKEIMLNIVSPLGQASAEILEKAEYEVSSGLENRECSRFYDEKENVEYAYHVLRSCVERGRQGWQDRETTIGRRYASNEGDSKGAFLRTFVAPIIHYISENLDYNDVLIDIIIRYKRLVEWFDREQLRENLELPQNKSHKEAFLAKHLYRFLLVEGVEYHIEPRSADGEIDLISEQIGEDRLLVEAKVFQGDKTKVKSAVNQAYKYTENYNQPRSFVVFYDLNPKPIHFSMKSSEKNFSTINIHGKLIFLVTIDLLARPSASKLGPLDRIEISETDLLGATTAQTDSTLIRQCDASGDN
jgi:hypothetical protein